MMLINGVATTSLDARDRGLHYGDGVFTTARVARGEVLLWERHVARLQDNCARLAIPAPDAALLRTEAQQLCAGVAQGIIKVTVTRGVGGRGYAAPQEAQPTRLVALHPWPDYPQTNWDDGVALRVNALRLARQPALAGVKHLNRLEQVLARAEWNDPAIAEGLMCNEHGDVIEATAANIFVVRNGELHTPDLSECGVAGVMRAFSRGAPVRLLLPAFTGTGDLYWYVRADSPIKKITDAGAQHTIAYSTSGSSSNNIVVAFGQELGVKAKPTATGGPPGTFTQVMTGQIDIGWSAPPFGLKDIKEGKIRIVARGSDIPSLKGQTVRAIIVNANALKEKRDAILRFAKAYREAVDWMYADPKALAMYSEKVKQPVDVLRESLKEFHPKSAMQTEAMADLNGAVADAVKLKFLEAPLSKEQLAEFLQIPPAK